MISESQKKRAETMYNGLSLDWDAIDYAIRTQHKDLTDEEIADKFGATLSQVRKRRYRVLGITFGRGRPKRKREE